MEPTLPGPVCLHSTWAPVFPLVHPFRSGPISQARPRNSAVSSQRFSLPGNFS